MKNEYHCLWILSSKFQERREQATIRRNKEINKLSNLKWIFKNGSRISATNVCVYGVMSLQLFLTLWTVACQAPLSLGFSQQEYWSGCRALLQRIFLTQGWNPPLSLLHWQVGSLPLALPGKPTTNLENTIFKKILFMVFMSTIKTSQYSFG